MFFTIREFKRNPFSLDRVLDDRDPEALYDWAVTKKGEDWALSSGGVFRQYESLLKYFDLSHLSELEGMDVEIPDELSPNINNALELFVLVVRNGGVYTPPSQASLVERILDALAAVQVDHMENVDHNSAYAAARFIFYGEPEEGDIRMTDTRRDWLLKEIKKRGSEQIVAIEQANPADFSIRIKGPAEYFLFYGRCGSGTKVIFGPYADPISILTS